MRSPYEQQSLDYPVDNAEVRAKSGQLSLNDELSLARLAGLERGIAMATPENEDQAAEDLLALNRLGKLLMREMRAHG